MLPFAAEARVKLSNVHGPEFGKKDLHHWPSVRPDLLLDDWTLPAQASRTFSQNLFRNVDEITLVHRPRSSGRI